MIHQVPFLWLITTRHDFRCNLLVVTKGVQIRAGYTWLHAGSSAMPRPCAAFLNGKASCHCQPRAPRRVRHKMLWTLLAFCYTFVYNHIIYFLITFCLKKEYMAFYMVACFSQKEKNVSDVLPNYCKPHVSFWGICFNFERNQLFSLMRKYWWTQRAEMGAISRGRLVVSAIDKCNRTTKGRI
jgi:hypothetical protein